MPPLNPAPQTLRVDLNGQLAGSVPWNQRFFVKYAGQAPTIANLNAFATSVASVWTTNIAPLANANIHLNTVTAVDLTSSTAAEGTATSTAVGTRAGVLLPASSAVVVSYEIAVRYRGGHPRGYWPLGVAADMQGSNDWTAAFVSACKAGVTNFFTAVIQSGWTGSSGLTHSAVSYFYTPYPKPPQPPFTVPRPVPIVYPVTSYIARVSIGTQRRRVHYNG